MSIVQISIQRSGSGAKPPASCACPDVPSSRLRLEAAAVCCIAMRRFGEEGANPSCTSLTKCDMASVSAGCSSSGLAFST